MAIINPPSPFVLPSLPADSGLRTRLFAPALSQLEHCSLSRRCPELSDSLWLQMGVSRCLLPQPSGRGFLQSIASLDPALDPGLSHFFEALKSTRRLNLLRELNSRLCELGKNSLPDTLAAFPCLAGFDIYAGDGHFHQHAVHDRPDSQGVKHAVGHLYGRNLRTGLLHHLTALDQVRRKKEHDMRALKRQSIAAMRQGAGKGRKVLHIWDRAGIDFKQWHEWKQGSGIYILSRAKENMALIKCGDLAFDRDDPLNAGVEKDELVGPSGNGALMRRVTYRDSLSGELYEYLTTLTDSKVPPGVLALLYKMRWDIEKSFDEFKNKLGEKKAWASSATAKEMQAQFLVLAHNLLCFLERHLAKEQGIVNQPEDKRRDKRMKTDKEQAQNQGRALPATLELARRFTQHSVKLIRWVAVQLWISNSWQSACAALAALYAHL